MTNIPQELQIDQDRTPVLILGISGSWRKASLAPLRLR